MSAASRPLRWSRRLAPVVVGAAVLVASVSEPSGGSPAPILGVPADKLLHGVAYATLAAAVALGLAAPRGNAASTGAAATVPAAPAGAPGVTRRRTVLLAVTVAAAYGLAMEGLQGPLPYRTFDLLDAATNAAGAAVGAGAWTAGATLRDRER